MVLSGQETMDTENLKHSHELQILDRKEDIAKEEHKRSIERLAREYDIAIVSARADPKMIETLNVIASNINDLTVSLRTYPVQVMRSP